MQVAAAAVTLDKGIGLHQNCHPVSLLENLQSAEAVESGVSGAASDPAVLCSDGAGRMTIVSDRSREAYFVKIRIPRITCLTSV